MIRYEKNLKGYVDLDPWGSMPAPVLPLSIIYVIFSICYTIYTREIDDLITYAGIPALIVTGFVFVVMFYAYRESINVVQRYANLIALASAPVAGAAFTAFYFALFVPPWDMFSWLYAHSTATTGSILLTSAATLLTGTVLFYFRLKARTFYGLTEAVAGVSIAGFKALEIGEFNALANPNFYLVVLTAGVYLVVRGLDNMHQGIVREPVDPYAHKLSVWWKTLGQPMEVPPRLNTSAKARLLAMRKRIRGKRRY